MKRKLPLKNFPDTLSIIQHQNIQPRAKTIFEGTLNDSGAAIVKPNFELDENAPGMLNANLVVKVFEPGGSFSIDNMTLPYSPYTSLCWLEIARWR